MINKFQSERPVLSNVSLFPERVFNSDSGRVYATVSGHVIRITSGKFGTRIEIRKWDQIDATGGSYAELPGEVLCRDTNFCPPVMSSGDYIGMPTTTAYTSRVVVMYTILLVPTLEVRARGCIFDNSTNFIHVTQVKTLWGEVIRYFCGSFFIVLLSAVVGIVLAFKEAEESLVNTSRYPLTVQQDPMQSELLRTL